jgi:putative tryptophan/tyrosine transport system substrate-binding protein
MGPAIGFTIQAAAPSLRMEVNPVNMRDAPQIERAIAAFARSPNGGLIVTAGGSAYANRDLMSCLLLGTTCLRSTLSAPLSAAAA